MADRQAPKAKAPVGKEKPKDGDKAEAGKADAPDAEDGADEAENDAGEEDSEVEESNTPAQDPDAADIDPDTGLNRPVEGFKPVPTAEPGDEPMDVPPIPDGKIAVLDSPNNFGIHIGGLLHQFKKGKTPLTQKQYEACYNDSYVADNGALLVFMNKAVPKAKPKSKS